MLNVCINLPVRQGKNEVSVGINANTWPKSLKVKYDIVCFLLVFAFNSF